MTTNNPIAFNTKEELLEFSNNNLLEFSNNNNYNVKENTENLIKFIQDNAGKFLYLRGANLRGANLFCADLRDTDLWGANLWGADLRGADLRGAKGVYYLNTEYYNIYFHKQQIQIGCKIHTLEEWENFTDDDIDKMDKGKALLFWKKYKDEVFSLYKSFLINL